MKPIKETKEGYFYQFPQDKFYIVRFLDGGWIHLYPVEDGELPISFNSIEEAINSNTYQWAINKKAYKVVSSEEASKYEVPKRW